VPPLETALCVEVVAYLDEDGDGHGAGDPVTLSCGLVPQYVTTAGDCDDTDRGVSPVAYERCGSGVDEDCDGAVDEAPEPNVILMDGFDSDCVLAHEPGVVTEVVATAWRGHILENIGDGLAVGDFTGDGSLDLLAVGNLNPEVGLDLYGDRRGGGLLGERVPAAWARRGGGARGGVGPSWGYRRRDCKSVAGRRPEWGWVHGSLLR
jgi:hypothetical protein